MLHSEEDERRAREIIGYYTIVAGLSGGVPVPATSAMVVANNGFMLAHISAVMRQNISWSGVVTSLGLAGSLNIAGRSVFVEAAKALGWGTGSLWALAALSAVGATTASLQTYAIGLIALEMARNGGEPIAAGSAARAIESARENLSTFVDEMKAKKIRDPGPISPDPEEPI